MLAFKDRSTRIDPRWGGRVDPAGREEMRNIMAQMPDPMPPATLEDVVAHIDHVVKIAC